MSRTARLVRIVAVLVGVGGVAAPAAAATPPDAELVTVTDTSFAATWTTAEPSDTTVCIDDRPCVEQEALTRFHYAEVGGLVPGKRYSYSLRSGGLPQPASMTNPGSFTTLVPPPGRLLFEFALVSDVHIGEGCSGTAVTAPPPLGSLPPCFSSDPSEPSYAATLARATVEELNDRGIRHAALNADSTSHGEYDDVAELKQIFDGLEGEWWPARGSHDRAGQNDTETRCGEEEDCFRELLFPDRPSGRVFYSFDWAGHHFVALDSANPGDGSGDLTDPDQRAFLERDLEAARRAGKKTFIFFHHPVTEYANTTSFPPVIFGVRPERGRQEFLDLMGRYPNVVGVLNSHTHRNYVSYAPASGVGLPYIENGPTKEYPNGYSVFRVYEGGYMRNFHRLRCEFCRSWASRTRDQYFGLYPQYTLGTLSARNFTHVYNCSAPTPPPSPPTGNEGFIGGDTARLICPSATGPGQDGDAPGDGGPGDGGGSRGNEPGGGGAGNDAARCFRAATAARGNRVGRAGLARRRSSVRRTFGASGRYRRFVDRYCLRDGGAVRVAYPSRRELRRLSRSERRRIGGESIFVLTTSRSLRMRGVRRGTSKRVMRRRIGRGPRVRVGRNVWYFRKGANSRHVFKVQGGSVREMGIADARLTAGRAHAKRFFRQGR